MDKPIKLEFEGYFEEEDLPLVDEYSCSGIYSVYAGKIVPTDECKIRELLYIGEAKKLSERLDRDHEKYDDWDSLANKRAGIRLMTKVNVTTQTGGTNTNNLNNSQWQFLTWDMNDTAYVDFIRGVDGASSADQAWQYGPRQWAMQRSGWTSFKLKYPINPGQHRWLDTGEDWAAKYGMNFSDTFFARSDLTVNHTNANPTQ